MQTLNTQVTGEVSKVLSALSIESPSWSDDNRIPAFLKSDHKDHEKRLRQPGEDLKFWIELVMHGSEMDGRIGFEHLGDTDLFAQSRAVCVHSLIPTPPYFRAYSPIYRISKPIGGSSTHLTQFIICQDPFERIANHLSPLSCPVIDLLIHASCLGLFRTPRQDACSRTFCICILVPWTQLKRNGEVRC